MHTNPTVLVVDDDPFFREAAAAELRARGMTAESVPGAGDALAIARQRRPDLLILDGLLPGTDGIGLLQELRREGVTSPAMLLSAFGSDPETSRRLRELGVVLVLHKPLAAREIAEAAAELTGIGSYSNGALGELDAIRREFAAEAPRRLGELLDALAEVGAGASAERAHLLAHRLHGTLGSYGLAEAAELAGRIERVLEPSTSGASPELAEAIEALQVELEDLLARPLASEVCREELAPARPDEELRVLVVDDDEAFCDHVRALGREQLVRVLPASGTDDAVSVALRERLDGAIIDIHLERPDHGFLLASRLRERPGLSDLPLAFVSGDTTFETRVGAVHAGGLLFLDKPLGEEAFRTACAIFSAHSRAERPRVVLVDDDPTVVAEVVSVLAPQGVLVESVGTAARVLPALDSVQPDMLLLDVHLPGASGLDICRMVRATPRWRALPVVFLTGLDTAEARVACFEAGGDDYIAKPVTRGELLARVRVRLHHARQLADLAMRDPTTGLLNRQALMEGLEMQVAATRREGGILTGAMIDLDHLKRINDERGHFAGDRALAAVGRLFKTRFRATDIRGRWGGDEFFVGLRGVDAATLAKVLERALVEAAGVPVPDDAGKLFFVSFSAGVASIPADGSTSRELLLAADRRLYEAKRGGRRRVVT